MATGPIATFGAITGGAGYTDGTYTAVPLTGGSGTGAAANITVSGGAVTAVALPALSTSAVPDRTGKNYQLTDTLAFDDAAYGGGAGFSVAIGTLADACENCYFGRIVPANSGDLSGTRYCGFEALQNSNTAVRTVYDTLSVPDDFWCGEGAAGAAGTSFSSPVNSLPSTSPGSFSTWVNYTPTIRPDTGVITVASAAGNYVQVGATCFFNAVVAISSNGTGGGAFLAVGVPASGAAAPGGGSYSFSCTIYNANTITYASGLALGGFGTEMLIRDSASAYPAFDNCYIFVTGTFPVA